MIDVTTREIVRTIDVSGLVGQPSLTLEGCASARVQSFESVSGTLPRAYLHAAANTTNVAGDPQPWFVVLDQEALADLDPLRPILVASHRLDPPLPALPEGRALDVAVLNTPSISAVASGEPIIAPPPKPMMAMPVAMPRRSGNHLMSVDTGEM